MLHTFLWGHASVSDVLLFDCDDIIFSYPVDDEVLCSCARSVERFKVSYFPLPLRFFDWSYYCCCIGCSGILGAYADGLIVHPRDVADDGTVILHRDDDGDVSIGASFL